MTTPIGEALKKRRPPGCRAVRASRDRGHPARRGRAASGVRPAQGRRRIRQPRSLALSRHGHQGHDRRGRTSLEGSRSQEPDGQGAGDAGGPARDRAPDRRRHQHQHHAAVFAESLCAGGRGLSRRPRKIHRRRRRSLPCRQRRQFLRQPHRQRGRQAARREDRQGQRSDREGAAAGAEGESGDCERQDGLPGLQKTVFRPALGQARSQRGKTATAAVGLDRNEK